MRVLSIDIECLPPEDGTFPQAKNNEVITVGLVCSNLYKLHTPHQKLVFQLNTCKALTNASTVYFDTEVELLKTLHLFILKYDPDVLAGYNSTKFDWK